jgi:predicted O-methyltransferase YrrM
MSINVSRAVAIPGYMAEKELLWLAAQAARAPVIVEIGSWKGRSTRALGDHALGTVFAVDHWKGQLRDPAAAPTREIQVRCKGDGQMIRREFDENLADLIKVRKVVPVDWNSQDGLPPTLVPFREKVDFLFIDGDHSYVGCRSDIETYGPLLRPGGILSGHDYNTQPRHAGVRRIVDELYASRTQFCKTIWWVIQ